MNMSTLFFSVVAVWIFCINAEIVNLSVANAQKNETIAILLAVIGKQTPEMNEVSNLVKKALEFKNQCTVSVAFIPQIMTKKEAINQKEKGFSYIIFLDGSDKKNFEWHLFDVDDASMKKNKMVAKKGAVVRGWAYALADSMYESLTNEPGFFSTKIAYGKQMPLKRGMHYTHIYIADYDGSNEECIVQTPTINVSPRWNADGRRPLLFYSENTNSNMRMMAVDMHKKRVVASNFDGLNMLPAFSPDGKSVIYCATRGDANCHLYHWSNKVLKKVTSNDGNNFSPVFGDDGKTIYFSSDFETGKPQIYSYNIDNAQLVRITKDGYCVSPTYCPARKQLAYAKMVNGVMQLFSYDLATQEHRQLTTDAAQKEECNWSPCGTFLLCPVDNGNVTRIALFNTITHDYRYLTSAQDNCQYPTWSGVYNEYPVIS